MRPIVLIAALVYPALAISADLDVAKGSLLKSMFGMTQTLSVKNDTGAPLQTIIAECGFYSHGSLLVSATGVTSRLQSGQTGFIEVTATEGASDADATKCRVWGH